MLKWKKQTFEVMMHGWSDSNDAKTSENWRNILGILVFLEVCPVMFRSGIQKYVSLSVIEAELNAGVVCAQEMLYMIQVLQSLKL